MTRIEMKIHPLFVLILLAMLVLGCGPVSRGQTDRTRMNLLFQGCLQTIPPGPQTTHYNDWDEVIEACNSIAREQSWYYDTVGAPSPWADDTMAYKPAE